MKFYLVKKANSLFAAAYDTDHEAVKSIAVGELIEVEYKKKRNYQYHKKFFAMLKFVLENCPDVIDNNTGEIKPLFRSIEQILAYIKLQIHYDSILINGCETRLPKSISFSAMDNVEFENFYNKTFDVVREIINIEKQELEQELINYY